MAIEPRNGARLADPPECPPGWSTGPPDFVGIGAQRAGTTWWHRAAIKQHPRVADELGQRKERHFFDRFWTGEVPDDFAEQYHRLFPRPPGSIAGEWTPRYMHDFWALPLLRRAAPRARILVMLRDPVERYLSGIARELRIGEREGSHLYLPVVGDAVVRGLYCQQLRRVFELFPREQVLVLQYERCRAESVAEMRRTQEFLGLEPLAEPPPQLFRHRRPSDLKPALSDAMRRELFARLEDDVAALRELCPEIDLGMWPNFRDLAADREPSQPPGAQR